MSGMSKVGLGLCLCGAWLGGAASAQEDSKPPVLPLNWVEVGKLERGENAHSGEDMAGVIRFRNLPSYDPKVSLFITDEGLPCVVHDGLGSWNVKQLLRDGKWILAAKAEPNRSAPKEAALIPNPRVGQYIQYSLNGARLQATKEKHEAIFDADRLVSELSRDTDPEIDAQEDESWPRMTMAERRKNIERRLAEMFQTLAERRSINWMRIGELTFGIAHYEHYDEEWSDRLESPRLMRLLAVRDYPEIESDEIIEGRRFIQIDPLFSRWSEGSPLDEDIATPLGIWRGRLLLQGNSYLLRDLKSMAYFEFTVDPAHDDRGYDGETRVALFGDFLYVLCNGPWRVFRANLGECEWPKESGFALP